VIINKKLLIRVIVVFVIAAAIFFLGSALVVPALAVWIYLVFVVWKKKISLFRDQMEPKLAERRYKMLKAFLLIAGISLAGGIVGIVVHNVLYGLSETEEPVFFSIAISALLVFIIATVGGLVIFLKLRPDFTARLKELVSLRS
jgi:drug/metabolite transporter (DMT)-like permease